MRLLLDQNLPYSITKALAADCDVVHTEDVKGLILRPLVSPGESRTVT